MDSVIPPATTSQDGNIISINNTTLGAAIGVVVTLVAVVLITVVCTVAVYMYKKMSAVHQQRYSNSKTITCICSIEAIHIKGEIVILNAIHSSTYYTTTLLTTGK